MTRKEQVQFGKLIPKSSHHTQKEITSHTNQCLVVCFKKHVFEDKLTKH